ncbi:cell wall-binding repeat-containing protein [Agrococcus sp. 1P02AA]|uniref:cell wall-binding repeat-containing protein n=1 Tax=Agrococcus sp. 1P02AA TaxID=3132259 RepID=UPI0039A47E6C
MRPFLALATALALVATGLATAAAPARALAVDRIAGSDRFETSVEVSRNLGDITGGVVFLANGLTFPDALSAAPVVAAEGGDLLLTLPDRLPFSVAERIWELAPAEIVVVGSTASVSDAVLDQAAEAASAGSGTDLQQTRIGGVNRVETSLLLLDRLRESGPVTAAWIVSGANFPDALVAASVAGRYGEAVILDHHAPGSAGSRAWLELVGPHVRGLGLQIAGGEPSVSEADRVGLERAGATSTHRYAGRDRYETARLINESIPGAPASPHILLATGQNFPDALAGAVLSATAGVPMYLTPQSCHAAIRAMLVAETGRLGTQTVVGLGSEATLSDRTLALSPCTAPLPQQIGQIYGTFPMQRHTGTGPRTIDLGRSIAYAQVVARIRSSGFLALHSLDASRAHLDTFADGSSSYVGTTLIQPHGTATRYIRVDATGAWALEVRDLTSAPVLGSAASGGHDAVFLYGGSGGAVDFTTASSPLRPFVTEHWGARQLDEVSTAGSLRPGSGRLHAGPSVVQVRANDWTLRIR